MPLKHFTFVAVIKRALLYVLIALAFIAVIVILFAASVYTGLTVSSTWAAFVVWTACLCWLVVTQLRRYWHRSPFWIGMSGLLVLHVFCFIWVQQLVPEWRSIWFVPIVLVEAGVWAACLEWAVGLTTRVSSRRRHHGR